jgi:hypothetical protein
MSMWRCYGRGICFIEWILGQNFQVAPALALLPDFWERYYKTQSSLWSKKWLGAHVFVVVSSQSERNFHANSHRHLQAHRNTTMTKQQDSQMNPRHLHMGSQGRSTPICNRDGPTSLHGDKLSLIHAQYPTHGNAQVHQQNESVLSFTSSTCIDGAVNHGRKVPNGTDKLK